MKPLIEINRMRQIIFALLIHFCSFAFSQKIKSRINETPSSELIKHCGTLVPDDNWEKDFQQQIEQYIANINNGKKTAVTITIPIVVHVIYNNEPIGVGDNISYAQIASQINILNDDFAGVGFGASTIPTVFSAAKSNTQINFCLATLDKNGNTMAETGVDRIDFSSVFSGPYPIQFTLNDINTIVKPATIWDPSKYLNIWVFNSIQSLAPGSTTLGYATFPPSTGLIGIISSLVGTTLTDGLVIWNQAFGNVGIVNPTTSLGRTATHEIGHYLGLRHIWGDPQSGCGSDFCNDTPPAENANQNCPTYPYKPNNSCGSNSSGEMFMNFMDYTNDNCMSLFTNDQNTRMQTALTNSPLRSSLGTHGLCTSSSQLAECDTISNFSLLASNIDSSLASLYGGSWGWVSGHNSFQDIAKAEEFNYNAGTKKLVGAFMYLDHALTVSGNSNLTMSYWPNNGNVPSTSASQSINFPLLPIPEDVISYFAFSSPITVSPKFFVGIDNLTYGSNQDSIALFMAKSTAVSSNTAWEKQSNNTWFPYSTPNSSWGLNSSLCVFPVFACSNTSGVEEILNPINRTLFFPNPTVDKLYVVLSKDNDAANAKIIIQDAYGRIIRKENHIFDANKTISLSTSDLADGIYFIELVTDKKSEIKKISIKH
jgi:hypothetical protein